MAKKKQKASDGKRLLWKVVGITAAGVLVGVLLLITLVRKGVFGELPTEADLAELRNEEATLLLSREGVIIGKVFAEDRTNVRYKDLPKHLVNALVATEDQRFFTHQGVDAWSYVRVFFRTLLGRDRSGGGGSTISQQIIKNLYGRERHGPLTMPVNKIKEAIMAQRLEKVYDKEDVLTLYFNSVPFGENLYGVEAAAQRYFSKTTASLRTEEAAVLVGMLKANTSYNPRRHPERSKGRRDQVLELMAGRGYLTPAAKDSLRALPLRIRYTGLDALDAYGYFAAKVQQEARVLLRDKKKANGTPYDIEKDGLRVHTTLDTALQQAALRSLAAHLATMQPKLDQQLRAAKARSAWEKRMERQGGAAWKRNDKVLRDVFTWEDRRPDSLSYRDSLWHYHRMLHGAVLMMEPGGGQVRAWVGGNDHRTLPYDLVEAHRPIASTIKPVIYAAALTKGMAPCTYLDNTKKTYSEYDDWSPDNFGRDTIGGYVSMWYALAHSMNRPTVDLYFRTGVDTVRQTFQALGLPDRTVAEPAVALGAADISLKEIVGAYGAFAMRGHRTTPRSIEKITDAQGKVLYTAKKPTTVQALSPEVAAAVTTMLQRAVDSGTGASLRSRFGVTVPFAGKTGTSQDYSDAWFVGYTPGLVVGSWVGARDPSVHFSGNLGTGGQLALPIVARTMKQVQDRPALRSKYLLAFGWVADHEVDLECPERRTGLENALMRLFAPHEQREPDRPDEKPDPKERKGILRRIFGKR